MQNSLKQTSEISRNSDLDTGSVALAERSYEKFTDAGDSKLGNKLENKLENQLNNKPVVHFVHGNSYPSGTYRVFLTQLELHYQINSLAMHGHDAAYPVTDGWGNLVQELIDVLIKKYTQPVILVGHSFGGLLSLMVASIRPDLVRSVVMLDSPMVSGWRALILRVFKQFGWDKKYSPARFSEKRRTEWPDAQAAYQHFAAKKIFSVWAPEVLHDYIQAGTVADQNGVRLRFNREVETQIYLTLPHHLGQIARRGLAVPVGFVGGTDSAECRQVGWDATKKLVGTHFTLIPGGHLLPMESPHATAKAVHQMIQSFA